MPELHELLIGAAVVAAFLVAWAAHRLTRVRRSQRFVNGLPRPPRVYEAGCQSRTEALLDDAWDGDQ
jgi:hypothetical protein